MENTEAYFILTCLNTNLLFIKEALLWLSNPDKSNSSNSPRKEAKSQLAFDISLISNNSMFFKNVDYLLVSNYQEFLYLPFLLKYSPKARVVVNSLNHELGRIYLRDFYITLKNELILHDSLEEALKTDP